MGHVVVNTALVTDAVSVASFKPLPKIASLSPRATQITVTVSAGAEHGTFSVHTRPQ